MTEEQKVKILGGAAEFFLFNVAIPSGKYLPKKASEKLRHFAHYLWVKYARLDEF